MANPVRDNLRAAIFSGKNKSRNSVKINIFETEVEVRQPTLAQIVNLTKDDGTSPIIKALIEYCYVPGTNDKVFENGDVDSLLGLPTGQWLTDLNEAITKLSGVDIKEAEKNLEKTK